MGGTTLKDAINDDDNFITALKVLNIFAEKSELNDKANSADVYTKTLANTTFATKAALDDKANSADVYTKTLANTTFATKAALDDKANSADVYTKTLANTTFATKAALDDKANSADVYTKALAETTFVKAIDLKTKAAEKPVVEAIIASNDFPKFVKESDLKTKAAEKPVVEAILGAKGADNKSILVEKLGTFLDNENDKVYGNSQSAKEFLGAKGMKGPKGDTPLVENVATELVQDSTKLNKLKEEITKDSTFQNALAQDGTLLGKLTTKLAGTPDFKEAIKMEAAIKDAGFKEAVRAVGSETHYDMPSNQNEPLNWHISFSDSLLG
ncbi:hypothetical protein [Wolbachia endosymbiont of Ctenocephalides felis wCfeJ]|uniref:hypothetical protein n=1 Tax=Wolbachia endosymbiont of Ctenocephalides felis wCfeJ TaxID=2732594 RepID=UPI00144578C1|nr:hypothetical protein [Wolbachia endosymbiont of Ctenocephalides felis wCfeJ]WCR57920.1 MAG: hypothetical protein PG980_000392 [Wolbachia endosymbiont of Ctenocephalides felis wCfeJ]